MRAALALALVAGGTGCLKSVQHQCAQSTECTVSGVQGTCETTGFCSFPDPSCPGGQRYGELAGSLSNTCVGGAGGDGGADSPVVDAPVDMFVPDARECFGAGAYELCFAGMPPMGTVSLAGTLDTGSDARCVAMPQSWADAGQPDACLLLARDLAVTANLLVTGTRPLVLVGEHVRIDAVIDVASHRGGAVAPGGDPAQCNAFVATPVASTNGGGGGAGGSFMTKGGNGGRAQDVTSTGGTAAAPDGTAPTILRGGCAGQAGGDGTAAAGPPGAGGGAIFVAASQLSLPSTGAINVAGAGATGGGTFSGGSGAGSGGMIVIHTYELVLFGGRLIANGGGGASGGTGSVAGVSGDDPSQGAPLAAANGGTGGGSSGGDGFADVTQAQNGAGGQNNKAGGGGGGGGGYIQANIALTGVVASPGITVVP
jgi:hypothetical protein